MSKTKGERYNITVHENTRKTKYSKYPTAYGTVKITIHDTKTNTTYKRIGHWRKHGVFVPTFVTINSHKYEIDDLLDRTSNL